MPGRFEVAATLLLLAITGSAPAQSDEFLRTNPKFLQTFRPVIQSAARCTVRVQCDGKDVCLGVCVGPDGWILTKAHDLRGRIVCRLHDGQALNAQIFGVHDDHDLAMLKVSARLVNVIDFTNSQNTPAGAWVASVGQGVDPAAVGVVSVPTRQVIEAHLGAQVDSAPNGLLVLKILQKSAALKAGLRPMDVIVSVDGQQFTDPDQFQQRLAGHKPGDTLTLRVRRGNKEYDAKAVLQNRDQGNFRSEFQNRLGSELSNRRNGYAVILQHDTVLKPSDCGGPLVDLQGRVIGINISRAGRVETWALPAEIVHPLLADLKSGRYAPRPK